MPYKAEERDGKAVVVNEEDGEVRQECQDMEHARRLAHTLNELEKEDDDE